MCVCVCLCVYYTGFKVLAAKLDGMHLWAVVLDLSELPQCFVGDQHFLPN